MLRKNFNLESSLYKKKYIDRAIKDFGEDFSLCYTDGILIIEGETDYEVDEIFHEFMNYVISLHNEVV